MQISKENDDQVINDTKAIKHLFGSSLKYQISKQMYQSCSDMDEKLIKLQQSLKNESCDRFIFFLFGFGNSKGIVISADDCGQQGLFLYTPHPFLAVNS